MPFVVGVAGGSGSGKTTLVSELVRRLGPDAVTVVPHDAYYRDRGDVPPDERVLLNCDHPDALETDLLVAHLDALQAGRPVAVPVYDYAQFLRTPETTTAAPRPVIVVEGILILAEPALRERMDLRVFVDTDSDKRFIRRLLRDLRERGRSVDAVVRQYLATVQPMHQEFVEPSKRHAHVIIPEGGHNRMAVDMLVARIRSELAGG